MCTKLVFLLPFLLKITHVVICRIESEQNQTNDSRIIGQNANLIDWNFIVQVYSDGKSCAGSLITLDCVVTAAHCLGKSATIVAGTVGPETGITVKSKTILIHPKYPNEDGSFTNDIGLVKLENHINSSLVSPIDMKRGETPEGTICRGAGWGRDYLTSEEAEILKSKTSRKSTSNGSSVICQSRSTDGILKEVKIRVVNESKCDVFRFVKRNSVCAIPIVVGTDVCFGDSGGPLVCNGVLTGVLSYGGHHCADPEIPEVYTDFSRYSSWIGQSGCSRRTAPDFRRSDEAKSGVRCYKGKGHVWIKLFLTSYCLGLIL